MAALFHMSTSSTFNPPATLGLQVFSQETRAFLDQLLLPVHKNVLHTIFTIEMIFLGNKNIWAQYVCISNSTLLTSCNLPLEDRNLDDQHLTLATIFSIIGKHWCTINFLVNRGTRKYLNGNSPMVRFSFYKIWSLNSLDTPAIYRKLFSLFACNTDTSENAKIC